MLQASRLAHAILLRGPRGVGKADFASRLAGVLLCTSAAEAPCGRCRGCRLVASQTHPDLRLISPPEANKAIGVDQIRELIAHLALTASFGPYKVGVISPAERMSVSAANSLLKTLEEPPGDTVLVLVSHLSASLAATIRSRCQILDFPPTAEPGTGTWLSGRIPAGEDPRVLLRASGGRPLAALGLIEDGELEHRAAILADLSALARGDAHPVGVADGWRAHGIERTSRSVSSLVMDIVRLKATNDVSVLSNIGLADAMQPIADQLDLRALFALLDAAFDAARLRAAHAGLNEQSLLEDVALAWAAAPPNKS